MRVKMKSLGGAVHIVCKGSIAVTIIFMKEI
jgi:hypothetical protein